MQITLLAPGVEKQRKVQSLQKRRAVGIMAMQERTLGPHRQRVVKSFDYAQVISVTGVDTTTDNKPRALATITLLTSAPPHLRFNRHQPFSRRTIRP